MKELDLFSQLENQSQSKEIAVAEVVNDSKPNEVTITSLEIAELTGKRHDIVIRDIETILGRVIDAHRFEGIYKDAYGRDKKCYRLPKREALILVSGYSVELRAKIIDRLEYLENEFKKLNTAPQLPKSYKEALKELLNQVEENERLQLENEKQREKIALDKPKVDYAEAVLSAVNSQSIGDFAKMLASKGVNTGQNKFFAWLRKNRYLQSNNIPYKKYIDCGLFELLPQAYKNKDKRILTYKTLITAKGQYYFTMRLKSK